MADKQRPPGRSPADRLRRRMADDARVVESVLKAAPTGSPEFNAALADLFDRFADRIAALRVGAVESDPNPARGTTANEAERARGCDGKVRFKSEYAASGRAGAIALNGGVTMNAYHCRFCGCWHLGRHGGGSGLRGGGPSGAPQSVVLKMPWDELEAMNDTLSDALGDLVMLDRADPLLRLTERTARAVSSADRDR